MKKLPSTFIFLFFIFVQLFGQEQITIKTGDNLYNVVSSSRYLFPQFEDARVILRNETTEAKMNYNALTGQMEFINPNGEVASLLSNVQAVIIGNRFFKSTPKGYAEVMVSSADGTELLVHRKYKATSTKRTSAYGMPDETSALGSFYSLHVNQGIAYSLNEEVTYAIANSFYIYVAGKYLSANKSGFTKAFGKQRPALDAYLREQPVDFTNPEDVSRLFVYCTEE